MPGPGGLLDQDSYLVYLMSTVLQVRGEQHEKEAAQTNAEVEAAKRGARR